MDLTKYEKIFAQESERYLEELETLLMQVEKDLGNRDTWSEIHGKIHSIKGMAKALSLDKITDLSHPMEDWAKGFQQGSAEAASSAVQLLFESADLLRVLITRKGEIDSQETQEQYNALHARLKAGPNARTGNAHPENPSISPYTPERINHARVNYSLIEELLGLSQEILISEKTLPFPPQERLPPRLKNWLIHYQSLVKGLSVRLARLRLMSVADFTDLFVKTIRNLAKGYDREVRLEVIGGDVQADIALLDRLREPVMHLFRNAVAHGIESPEERMSAGKGPEGTITLEARRERDSLIIVIRDDGRGIDRSSIAGHLRDTRSMTDEQIHQMPRDDFFNTILSPDFSSSSKATDLAGRGIGMSVVSQTIAYLGASMNIRSEPSKGTEFTVRLPLSLAVIHAVTFVIGAYTLSVPTSSVESIGMREHVSTEDSDALYNLRALFGVNGGRKAFFILKLKHLAQTDSNNIRGEFRELAVDRIIGNGPLMVMPVGELLAKVGLLAGVGITENGDISLLLDLENLPEM